jgi:hypothetical protein
MDGLHIACVRAGQSWRVFRGEKLVGSIMRSRAGHVSWCWHSVDLWEYTAAQLVHVAPRGWEYANA